MQMGDTRLKGCDAGGAGTLSGREGRGGEGLSMDVMMPDRSTEA